MTQQEKEQVLEEVFEGEDAAGLRDATLSAGLRALRSKRRKRRAAYLTLGVLPLAILLHPFHEQKPVIAQTSPASAAPKVEEITTEQLFALFPNRPMALIGKPGDQQLVFLDQGRTSKP